MSWLTKIFGPSYAKVQQFHQACLYGYNTTLEKLLKKYPDLVHQPDSLGMYALHTASRHGHTATVNLLVEKGADINQKHFGNQSALYYATERMHKETIKLLLQKGADTNGIE